MARHTGTVLYATTATTHLGNIRSNLEGLGARVRADRPDRLVLAAVKANAYGHGAVEVASMIQRTGCADWLGIATVPEAIELRDAGITLPILKLSHCLAEDELRAAIEHGVTVAVVDAAGIDAAQAAASELGLVPWDRRLTSALRSEPHGHWVVQVDLDGAPALRVSGHVVFREPAPLTCGAPARSAVVPVVDDLRPLRA